MSQELWQLLTVAQTEQLHPQQVVRLMELEPLMPLLRLERLVKY
jgi:hypothetical protein